MRLRRCRIRDIIWYLCRVSMDEVELASIRKTEWAGAETYYFDKIDSTNTKAKELAEEGHPSGTFVIATSRLREKDVADGHGIPFREREFI